MMKQIVKLLFVLVCLNISVSRGQTRKESKKIFGKSYTFEASITGVGKEGMKVMKVWGIGKSSEDAVLQAKKNAVAICLFRGLPSGNGADETPKICTNDNSEEENAEFFEKFFSKKGKYQDFITATNDGVPDPQDRFKTKDGYKIGIAVEVKYDELRIYLENLGIVKKLDAGF